MKLYSIQRTNDISVIGFYPQTERTKQKGYHIDDYNSERNINPDSFPDFTPKYGLDLNLKSNETDVIDSGNLGFGLVVSERLKKILEEFKLPPSKFYAIDVYNSKTKYYWFHYITNITEYIDYPNTEIELYKNRAPFVVEELTSYDSFSELMTSKKSLPYNLGMRYKSIHLKSTFPNYDCFEITGAQYFTLLSFELSERLAKENITGLEYSEYDKVSLTPTL